MQRVINYIEKWKLHTQKKILPAKREPKQVKKYWEGRYISTGCPKIDGNKRPRCSLIHGGGRGIRRSKKTVTNILNDYII